VAAHCSRDIEPGFFGENLTNQPLVAECAWGIGLQVGAISAGIRRAARPCAVTGRAVGLSRGSSRNSSRPVGVAPMLGYCSQGFWRRVMLCR